MDAFPGMICDAAGHLDMRHFYHKSHWLGWKKQQPPPQTIAGLGDPWDEFYGEVIKPAMLSPSMDRLLERLAAYYVSRTPEDRIDMSHLKRVISAMGPALERLLADVSSGKTPDLEAVRRDIYQPLALGLPQEISGRDSTLGKDPVAKAFARLGEYLDWSRGLRKGRPNVEAIDPAVFDRFKPLFSRSPADLFAGILAPLAYLGKTDLRRVGVMMLSAAREFDRGLKLAFVYQDKYPATMEGVVMQLLRPYGMLQDEKDRPHMGPELSIEDWLKAYGPLPEKAQALEEGVSFLGAEKMLTSSSSSGSGSGSHAEIAEIGAGESSGRDYLLKDLWVPSCYGDPWLMEQETVRFYESALVYGYILTPASVRAHYTLPTKQGAKSLGKLGQMNRQVPMQFSDFNWNDAGSHIDKFTEVQVKFLFLDYMRAVVSVELMALYEFFELKRLAALTGYGKPPVAREYFGEFAQKLGTIRAGMAAAKNEKDWPVEPGPTEADVLGRIAWCVAFIMHKHDRLATKPKDIRRHFANKVKIQDCEVRGTYKALIYSKVGIRLKNASTSSQK